MTLPKFHSNLPGAEMRGELQQIRCKMIGVRRKVASVIAQDIVGN